MRPVVRQAEPADAAAVALVHVRAWQTAYRGIIPDDFLDNMSLPAREGAWKEGLEDPERRECTFVAEVNGEIVGFAGGGAERDGVVANGVDHDGELYAIYLLNEHRRQGIGRLLAAAVARCLLEHGHNAMLVWVLEANPARKFYEALGGTYVASKLATMAAGSYPEVAYGWPDLAGLVARLEESRGTESL